MSEHTAPTVERHCDVAVIGGSAAGLAAALQLGRQRRSVIVADAGEPRNAPAAHLHGYLGHEGRAPAEMLAIARAEVRGYGGEVLAARVVDVRRTEDDHFRVALTGGHTVTARRVLAATGLVDELPEIDGLAEQWGRGVIHCPFCHGYEVRDQRIVQILTHPVGLRAAGLFRQLSTELTLILHEGVDADSPEVDRLRTAGVRILDDRVRRVVSGDRGRVESVELAAGDHVAADVVAVGGRFRARAEVLASLGVVMVEHPTGLGDVVDTDPSGATSVPGLYAAGNVTDPTQQLLQAAAQGSLVGAMIGFDLADSDIEAADRPSAVRTDWDHRYGGAQVWSGNPNGSLVDEVDGLAPGRVLDVGAGEGGDAVWLAEHGWQVTAADISHRALDRIASAADDRELTIECLPADANAHRPFPAAGFDLVSAHYASIPRTADSRGIDNLLGAVAPGGTLLVVSHDLDAMRAVIDTTEHSRPFDPDAYLRVEDFLAALTDAPDWDIEIHDKRPRRPGAASASHHVDDIVLRARRRPGG
ncbi:MAG: FAD-dependent oxidoreductase [Nocardioides sp.]